MTTPDRVSNNIPKKKLKPSEFFFKYAEIGKEYSAKNIQKLLMKNHQPDLTYPQAKTIFYNLHNNKLIDLKVNSSVSPRTISLNSREKKPYKRKYSLEGCMKSSANYHNIGEWLKADQGSYYAATRSGWLIKCTAHMRASKLGTQVKHTLTTCMSIASKYKTKAQWIKSDPKSYDTARKKDGWVVECCAHMVNTSKYKQTDLGKLLYRVRTDKGLSRAELANKVGVKSRYIECIELGRKKAFKLPETLNKISKVLEFPLEALMVCDKDEHLKYFKEILASKGFQLLTDTFKGIDRLHQIKSVMGYVNLVTPLGFYVGKVNINKGPIHKLKAVSFQPEQNRWKVNHPQIEQGSCQEYFSTYIEAAFRKLQKCKNDMNTPYMSLNKKTSSINKGLPAGMSDCIKNGFLTARINLSSGKKLSKEKYYHCEVSKQKAKETLIQWMNMKTLNLLMELCFQHNIPFALLDKSMDELDFTHSNKVKLK